MLKFKQRLLLIFIVFLNACTTTPTSSNNKNINTHSLFNQGISQIENKEFSQASDTFQRILKYNTTSDKAHFFNAFAYHMQYLDGNSAKASFAEEGYKLAIKFDGTNWRYFHKLGEFYLDKKNYPLALEHLSKALKLNPNDTDVLYDFAVAAYYVMKPDMAVDAFEKIKLQRELTPLEAKGYTIASSAIDNPEALNQALSELREKGTEEQISYALQRIKDWKKIHRIVKRNGTPQIIENTSEVQSDENPKMIVVDIVIIKTEEDMSTTKGVNLLNGLTIQFGDATSDSFAWAKNNSTESIFRSIGLNKINYTMNIANIAGARNEVIARPTLVALDGEKSTFFSGKKIEAVVVGTNNVGISDAEPIESNVGVSLELLPEFLEDDNIKIAVTAERSFFSTPNTSSVTFQSRIDTTSTIVSANVIMKPNQTLILSGLSEKETESNRDGVPFLQDIPGLQYFFSKEIKRSFQRSIIILITPRRPLTNNLEGKEGQYSSVENLKNSHKDWFKSYPNWVAVEGHLRANSLYKEFRSADLTEESWKNIQTSSARIDEALKFLYY
jgi:tetratricopeptide (TPR) repeat protein